MRRAAILVLLLLLGGAGAGAYFAYDWMGEESTGLAGFMEARLVLVAAEDAGRLIDLTVAEGDTIEADAPLFRLESRVQEATVEAARARLREAETALELSRLSLERAQDLHQRGAAPQARLDEARATFERDQAAEAAARASLEEVEARLGQRTVAAPVSGSVEEVYFRPGEVAGAGQPVVALLPPENLRLRFYVPEPRRAAVRIGDTVGLSCDGCPEGLTATVSFISREAEFTPPVIFSREERRKLVYLVEATPDEAARELTAGQPVTVALESPPAARAEARAP